MKLRIWIYMEMWEAAHAGNKARIKELWKMKEDNLHLYPRLEKWLKRNKQ